MADDQLDSDVSRRLLAALPPVLVVPARDVAGHVMDIVLGEIQRDEPGQQSVLDRWLDLALIVTLRAWFARPESHAPGWYQAQSDPVVGLALRLMHEDPAYRWSVAELADRTGVSMVIVTHDRGQANRLATRIVNLREGRVAA